MVRELSTEACPGTGPSSADRSPYVIVRTRSIAVRLLPCAPGGMFHRATDEPEHLSHYGQPLHRPRSTEITSAPIGVRTVRHSIGIFDRRHRSRICRIEIRPFQACQLRQLAATACSHHPRSSSPGAEHWTAPDRSSFLISNSRVGRAYIQLDRPNKGIGLDTDSIMGFTTQRTTPSSACILAPRVP